MKGRGIHKIFLFLGLFVFSFFGARAANAATLYLSPSSGDFTVGNIFTANILVNTEGVTINNADATVNFPSGLLEVVSFSKSGSIFSLWVEEPSFSNGAGTLSFNGGLPTPGFNGATGKVLSAVFRVKKAGSASLIFSSAAVRANDGEGTDVFKTGVQAKFNLTSEERPLPPPPVTPGTPKAPNISSSTHPDSTKWYANNNPVFKWDLPSGVNEVTLVLGTRANSPPIISYTPPISEKTLTDVGDGIWYFNARFRNSAGLGPITSFKFNVDTQPPRNFSIIRLDTDDLTNPQPQLAFATTDDGSGLDRYEMKIGEGDWFKIMSDLVRPAYKMPLQLPGSHMVVVRAFDMANNYSEAKYQLEVQSIEPPVIDAIEKPETKARETIAITGRAKPNQKVLVSVRVNPLYVLETVADANGYWRVEFKPESVGRYEVTAQAVDERGAVSVDSNHVTFNVTSAPIPKLIVNLLMKGFDSLINFVINGWLLIFATLLIIGLVYAMVKKAVPAVKREIKKIRHIMGEYRMDKKLKKKDRKIRLEIRMISEDIRKELALLKKIESHRHLHPDEQYLKNKLETYINLITSMKG